MISVISIYNNRQVFNHCLLRSLSRQEGQFQSILVDNTDGTYKSAAAAFNEVIERATGEFILFCHQDVVFESNRWLIEVEKAIKSLTNIGVIGVAGCKENTRGVFTNITHGPNRISAGQYRITIPIEVQTVDECLFIVPRRIFSTLRFDETTCFGWHLYAADLCLSGLLEGYSCYVIPAEMYHMSSGASLDIAYYKTGKLLAKKYRSKFRIINTTCSSWKTNHPSAQYYAYWVKYGLRKGLPYSLLKKSVSLSS